MKFRDTITVVIKGFAQGHHCGVGEGGARASPNPFQSYQIRVLNQEPSHHKVAHHNFCCNVRLATGESSNVPLATCPMFAFKEPPVFVYSPGSVNRNQTKGLGPGVGRGSARASISGLLEFWSSHDGAEMEEEREMAGKSPSVLPPVTAHRTKQPRSSRSEKKK